MPILYQAETVEKVAGTYVAEWLDGNPSGEDRIGRFVTSANNENKIVLANADSYVCGITESNNGSTTSVKVNPIGLTIVQDYGTLVSGDKCMPDNIGKAVKSSNELGYRVVSRIDSTHVEIIISPNNDMIQRIKVDSGDYALKTEVPTKISQLTNDSGYLTEHIDISGKVDKVAGKGLSTNDLTNTLKNNYDLAFTHSEQAHAPSNAQANVIESVKVDGTALTVSNKAVNIELSGKVDKVSGKGLSTNDLTNALKSNYDTAYTHSQSAHAPSSAQANVIETIKVNGSALTPSSKAVDITVPTKTSQLTNDSGFKTTDNNTTYSLSKNGSTITLTGSDGKTTSVTDSDTTYSAATQSANGLMSAADKTKLDGIATGANKTVVDSALSSTSTNPVQNKVINTALAGKSDTSHTHTKADIGLGNVTNDAQVKRSEMGTASGVATLGTDGKVPSSQLPSYVDDVLEYNGMSNFPSTGESGKIYVDTSDNKTYRWSGSAYIEISASIVVGTTTGTALDGKIGTDHINNKSNPHSVTKSQIGLGNVENKSSATIRGELTKANVTTALGYTPPTTDTTYGVATSSTLGLVKSGTDITVDASGNVSVNDDSHNHIISNIDGLQTALDGKSSTSHTHSAYVNQNAFSNVVIGSTTVAADSATDSLILVAGSNVTLTPDADNDQITIAAKDTTYSAATTSAAGLMSASDKSKLDGITASADAVSFTRSLTSGTKVGTITINGTGTDLYAPTNTDTHYTTGLKVGASNTATANAAATNGNVYLNALDNTTVRDSHKIVGTGATTVTSDANGVITINSTDNNTTYSAGTGLTLSGTQFKHSNSVTAATAQGDASKTLTFGGTFTIPTVTYDAQGHITGKGTTTMTMPANPNTDTKNTAGSTDTSSKIFLVGATSQAANPQTYSDNQVYVTNGQLDANKVRIAEKSTFVYNASTGCLEITV